MGKLKASDTEILQLGENIISDLKVDRMNTLAKWLAHYLAELIVRIKNSKSKIESAKLKKESIEIIIKLWSYRYKLQGFPSPYNDLDELVKVLKAIKSQNPYFQIWRQTSNEVENVSLQMFVKRLKEAAEEIFELCAIASLNQSVLFKENKWLKSKSLLTSKEKKVIVAVEAFINRSDVNILFEESNKPTKGIKSNNTKQRKKVIFSQIEKELNAINSHFELLKKKFE